MIKPKLKLTGQDGNAFFILARAYGAAMKCGWTKEEWQRFEEEAQSSDYDHLLQTVMKYFKTS